jgi:hypothetical protein
MDGKPANIRTYRDLVVWQKAMHMAEAVYRATEAFEGGERFWAR